MTNKRTYILLITISSVVVNLFSQKNIDFKHKTIQKEIKKTFDIESFELHVIPINKDSLMEGNFFSLSKSSNKYVYIGRVNSCKAGGCSINAKANGPSEYFDYFILFDAKAEVQLVKVFNYAATYGREIIAKGWLKQFTGHEKGDQLEVGKNIDSISGATISVYAITSDVKKKTAFLSKYVANKKQEKQTRILNMQ